MQPIYCLTEHDYDCSILAVRYYHSFTNAFREGKRLIIEAYEANALTDSLEESLNNWAHNYEVNGVVELSPLVFSDDD